MARGESVLFVALFFHRHVGGITGIVCLMLQVLVIASHHAIAGRVSVHVRALRAHFGAEEKEEI